ncbi:MAG TPA: DUF2268 domain-containing protein [Clostridiaceae bacterium]|nr:DUF2268 domain-containing protein [Clostridiaceae bacterium]
MGKINVLIANATHQFSMEDRVIISEAVKDAEIFINESFEFDYDVDVVVTAPSFLMKTIPEDGISGRTYNSRLIVLVINKEEKILTANAIFEIICHEMSHSLRWEKLPEYSDNLFKGMILEGLAIVLEQKAIEARGGEKQFFLERMLETTEDEYKKMVNELESSFSKTSYDYEGIFYTGNETLPRWAGYRLGYYFVQQYLKKTNRSIEQATLDSYTKFTFK